MYCLFVILRSTREFFTHMETSPLSASNLTYTRHSWPLSSEEFLAWHAYCDTGTRYTCIISERLTMELSLPVLPTYVCDQGSNPDLPHSSRTINHRATAAAGFSCKYIFQLEASNQIRCGKKRFFFSQRLKPNVCIPFAGNGDVWIFSNKTLNNIYIYNQWINLTIHILSQVIL